LAGFDEKPSRSEFVNAGIYVLAPEALDYIPASGAVDMPTLFQAIGQKVESPSIYPLREHWLDVGHLADLQRAQDEVHLFV
jgi:NDP-sugar pyrophosphorylase family protein